PYSLDLIVQDVARISEKKRRFEDYEGDVSGRYLSTWSYISRLLNQRPEKLDSVAEAILKCQTPEGYFGLQQMHDGWDEWGRQNFGHGRLLLGLLQYYKLSHNDRFLRAAEKLGDYFCKTVPEWAMLYPDNPYRFPDIGKLNWKDGKSVRRHFIRTHQTSILESLMMLYQVTHKGKYLQTAKSIVPLFPEFGQYHSHSFMNTLVGVAMLYSQTGDEKYLDLLQKDYWQGIFRHGRRFDGGIAEFFPTDLRTEGCSLVDWLRLNLQMWQITQQAVYLEEAERTWLNALNFHQTGSGAFGHATLSPTGYDAAYSESWWCCLMHGLYAYSEIVNNTLVARKNNLWINFYTPIKGQIDVNGNPLDFSMKTAYPAKGNISIVFSPREITDFTVHLRIPKWADEWQVAVNNQPVDGRYSDGTFILSRAWSPGDKLDLTFPVTLHIQDEAGNEVLHTRRFYRDDFQGYFLHGPLILAADLKWNDALPQSIHFILKNADDYKIAKDKSPATLFAVPEAHYKINADFDNKTAAVILVPMSEQTGYDKWSDKWRNFIRNGEKPYHRVPVRIKQNILISKE
ncbi:MAG: hypothetical protein GXO75_05610, partial [Calditrichaeota bacterium]|nr:hypothetical protein [Calditrichota bacterium]